MTGQYSRIRLGVVFIIFAAAFALFVGRLVTVQLVRGEELRQKARRQFQQAVEIPAARGEIYDARGNKVAANTCFQSLFAYPVSSDEIDGAYRQMTYILGKSRSELRAHHPLAEKRFRWIKRHLSEAELARFQNLKNPCGLYLREEPTRSYPYGDIGRALLGFVDLDNRGKSGVELVMDEQLTGRNGRYLIQKDGKGAEYPIREIPLQKSEAGRAVVLTVDWNKQQVVEEELRKAVEKYKAKGGVAVFLNPRTGAIIAAADYRPEQNDEDKPVKLGAVCDVFEPGSVFKLIVAAAALEDGRISPEDSLYAEEGVWHLGRRRLRDDHKFGWLSFREGFENSSNILMGKVADSIGGDKVLAMARRFGFGRKTRCGLNGESGGSVDAPPHWSKFTAAAFAIGHGVSVTALQLAQAYAGIASGGQIYQPYLVKGCVNEEGEVINRHQPHPVKILNEKIVAELDSFLRGVVEKGTGQPINDAPFPIAGKTGTAEKPNLVAGGYIKNKFMASFAGYFPADSPLVAGVVVLDEPEPIHYGGYTAGPAFRDMAVKFAALDNYHSAPGAAYRFDPGQIPESNEGGSVSVIVPDLSGVTPAKAGEELIKLELAPVFSGNGTRVLVTFPAAGARLAPGTAVRCLTGSNNDGRRELPDLRGLTLREAVTCLGQLGVRFTCRGQGRVKDQIPAPGREVNGEREVQLILAREDRGA